MNESFHTAGNLPLGRWCDFRIADAIRSRGHTFQRLVDDVQALLHFQHPHQVAIIHITVRTHRNVEIELFIAAIRESLANIPDHVAAAQDRAARAVGNSILRAQYAHSSCAFDPELVISQQIMIFLQAIKKYAGEVAHFAIKGGCQVGLQTAGADIAGHHTRARNLFKDIQDHLALAEAVEEDAHSSQIERVRTEPDEMAGDALQFRQ